MTSSILSNTQAASIRQSINQSITEAQRSSSKLATGKGITSAFEDAAGLSIGSGLRTDTSTLKTALTTTGQARLALNIADGALENISSILERQKSLAVQANSGALSDTERGFLDQEFQNGTNEINRLVSATEFNGVSLLDGSIDGRAELALTMAGTSAATEALVLDFGLTQDYTVNFAAAAVAYDDSTGIEVFDVTATAAQVATGMAATINANNAAGEDFDGVYAVAAGAVVTIKGVDQDDMSFTTTGTATGTVASYVINDEASVTPAALLTNEAVEGGEDTLDFQVGIATSDEISVSLSDARTAALFDNLTLAVSTEAGAVAASDQLDEALDKLKALRANVGSLQSRFEFAAANIATSVQNTESAAAAFLDADIAAESTTFSQAQVRMQAGISVLAQINQLPSALLKLI